MALLTHSRKVGTNPTETTGSLWATKGARKLLLDFGHTQVSLSLMSGKRDGEIIQKSEHLIGSVQKGIEQMHRP